MKFAVVYTALVCFAPVMLIAQVELPEPPLSVVASAGALLVAFAVWKKRKTT